MEYNVKYSEWILDTIDQLRKRKARPDLERICHMVERKHGPSFADIAAQLDKLVEAQVVVKVDYKGSTSYRNAAKWRKSHFGAVQNAASTTNKLVAAFRALGGWPAPVAEPGAAVAGASGDGSNLPGPGLENGNVSGNQSLNGDGLEAAGDSTAVNGLSLIVDKPPKSPMPISRESIEQWLLEQDPETNLIGDTLSVALEREVEAYTLEKVSDGAYMMGDPSKKPPPPEPKEKNKEKKPKAKTEKKPPSEKKPKPKKIAAEGSAPQSGTSTTENTPVKTVKPDPIKTEEIKIEIPEATEFKITEHPSTPVKTTPVKEVKVKEEKSALSPKKGRPISGKRKRIRKSHGPEFEESFTPPRAKERRRISADTRSSHSREQVEEDDVDEEVAEVNEAPASSAVVQKEPRCDYCLFSARCNKQGAAEELLFCKDCQGKAHPSCMNYSAALARRARNSPWQCIECKTCYICTESRDPDNMLFCDACDKGYHTDCHDPPIKSKPTGKWVCTKCQMELGVEEYMEIDESAANGSEGIGASGPITPSESPLTFEHDRPKFSKSESTAKLNGSTAGVESTSVSGSLLLPRLADTLTADVPDATNWTIEDVVNFFSDKGFTQWAEVFSEQEIDGRSLLLMKRSDVLQGLGLKLGPAIKIFAHVQRLQTRGQIAL